MTGRFDCANGAEMWALVEVRGFSHQVYESSTAQRVKLAAPLYNTEILSEFHPNSFLANTERFVGVAPHGRVGEINQPRAIFEPFGCSAGGPEFDS